MYLTEIAPECLLLPTWIMPLGVTGLHSVRHCQNIFMTTSEEFGLISPIIDNLLTDRPDADVLLGTLDSAFLFAYAAGMFVR